MVQGQERFREPLVKRQFHYCFSEKSSAGISGRVTQGIQWRSQAWESIRIQGSEHQSICIFCLASNSNYAVLSGETVEHLAYLNPVTGRIFRKRVIAQAYDFKLFASPKQEKSLHEQYAQILDTLSKEGPSRNDGGNPGNTIRTKDFTVNLGGGTRAVVRKGDYRGFLDFRHLKSPKERWRLTLPWLCYFKKTSFRLHTFTLNQKQFRIL